MFKVSVLNQKRPTLFTAVKYLDNTNTVVKLEILNTQTENKILNIWTSIASLSTLDLIGKNVPLFSVH